MDAVSSLTTSTGLRNPLTAVAYLATGVAIGLGLTLFLLAPRAAATYLTTFATISLGIFVEAVPFLLLGTLASGMVEVFVDQETLARYIPRRALAASFGGALLGLAFPVCECGVVPLARRLFRKGLPLSSGVAFLLAAPVVNPVVLLSTAAAFGWGGMLAWRVGLSLGIAVLTGLLFASERDPANLLRPLSPSTGFEHDHPSGTVRTRLGRALVIAGDEFFEMGRFLVVGALLAALLQTVVPQSALLRVGGHPFLSVVAMMGLAFALSLCSTVDSFVALAFTGSFTPAAILAFLVYGPMVDIKSTLMLLGVFRRRPVAYLVLLPLLMTLVATVAINLAGSALWGGWTR